MNWQTLNSFVESFGFGQINAHCSVSNYAVTDLSCTEMLDWTKLNLNNSKCHKTFCIVIALILKFYRIFILLQLVIVGVWITSALYSAPKFIWVQTITNDLEDGQTETICITHRRKYDSELFDMINFGLLYVIPLCVMTVSSDSFLIELKNKRIYNI